MHFYSTLTVAVETSHIVVSACSSIDNSWEDLLSYASWSSMPFSIPQLISLLNGETLKSELQRTIWAASHGWRSDHASFEISFSGFKGFVHNKLDLLNDKVIYSNATGLNIFFLLTAQLHSLQWNCIWFTQVWGGNQVAYRNVFIWNIFGKEG